MSDHDVAPAGSSLAALHALTAAAHARFCPGSPPPVITGPPPQPAVPPMAAPPPTRPQAAGRDPGYVPLSEENKLFLARLRAPFLPAPAPAPVAATAVAAREDAPATPAVVNGPFPAVASPAPAPSPAATTRPDATATATTTPAAPAPSLPPASLTPKPTRTPMPALSPSRTAASAIHPAILRRYGSPPQSAPAGLRQDSPGPADRPPVTRPHRNDSANRPGRYDDTPPQPAVPDLSTCLLTAARLADLVIPQRQALLDRWLCQGDLGYIFAPRGVGKTWMAMALPRALSLGQPLGLWQAGNAAPESSSAAARPPGTPAAILGDRRTHQRRRSFQPSAASVPDLTPRPAPFHPLHRWRDAAGAHPAALPPP